MAQIATWTCWGLVVVTWIAGAVYGARKSPRGRRQGRETGSLWRLAALAVAIAAYRLSRHHLNGVTDHSGWIELPGLVLLAISTAFTIWARLELGRMWSASPNVLQADHRLRTDGPYAVTRHPIYTGLFGMVLGTVLLNGVGDSLAVLVVAAVFLASRIPVEERLMSKTFPEQYADYRERVPRFVPGLRPLRRSH
jgi:protein-S-isoprenylcysteine O-methyltransferase Ste14